MEPSVRDMRGYLIERDDEVAFATLNYKRSYLRCGTVTAVTEKTVTIAYEVNGRQMTITRHPSEVFVS